MDDATRTALAEKIGFFMDSKRSLQQSKMLLIGFFDPEIYSISVYEDEEASLTYIDCSAPDDDLFWTDLIDIWKAQPQKHQWQTLEALLEEDEIKLHFFYADKPLGKTEDFPPREPIIQKYFGDKPIVYPPLAHLGPEDLGFEL